MSPRPKGVRLTEKEIAVILSRMYLQDKTVGEIAAIIGINYFELYNPLNGRTGCSQRVYGLIRDWLNRH